MMRDDDFKLLRGFAEGQMYEQTFVIVKLILRLKNQFAQFARGNKV